MNILFLDQYNSLGGAQHCLLDLLPAMRQRGWNAQVAIPEHGPLSARVESAGFSVHSISCGRYTSTRKTLLDFARFAAETPALAKRISGLAVSQQIELFYVNGPRLLPAAALAASQSATPLVFHCHVRLEQSTVARLAGWSLRKAHATMIGCCEFAVAPLQEYVEPQNIQVIYNGTADISEGWKRPDPGRVCRIAIIGRIEPDKGQIQFVESARILQQDFPGLEFTVIGAPLFSSPAYLERVREAARGLPIEFAGWQEDIGRAFSKIDLLVVPSAPHDPNPRVVLEAFSARVPVVAFPSGGIPEVIEDGVTGFLTRSHRAEALAARIYDVLLMDPLKRNEVVQRARAAWERDHTLERYRREIADVISQTALHRSQEHKSRSSKLASFRISS